MLLTRGSINYILPHLRPLSLSRLRVLNPLSLNGIKKEIWECKEDLTPTDWAIESWRYILM